MDIDFYENEFIVYLSNEEVDNLITGGRILDDVYNHYTQEEMTISVHGSLNECSDVEYYDDTLEALKRAYEITKKIENGVVPDKDEAEKIWNTYKHYKEQQQKYK